LDELQRLPPAAQKQALSRPADTARLAQNILIRRELARQAELAGLQNDARVAATLRAARERVLMDAMLARAEGQMPERAVLERLARNQYDAAPAKFDVPEQVRVRHILISAKSCEPKAKAQELLARARQSGADFAALAAANSDDPGSAAQGGDLGFFPRGRMTKAFEDAAFALKKPGDLSDVVETEFGFHVIRLEERKPATRQPFGEVSDALVKSLAESEARVRRQEALDKITGSVQFNQEAIEAFVAGRRTAERGAN
jgi:peptidyl-prolyl cis-trans isomerase C